MKTTRRKPQASLTMRARIVRGLVAALAIAALPVLSTTAQASDAGTSDVDTAVAEIDVHLDADMIGTELDGAFMAGR